jgi:hypothetical protein
MKKLILSSVAIMVAANSIALAESDRVARVNSMTQIQRQALEQGLIEQIDEVREDLEIIKNEIKQTRTLRMEAASSSLKASIATAVSGISTILLASKIPVLKKNGQQFEATTATAVIGALSLYFGKKAYDETAKSEDLGKSEVAEIAEARRLQKDLSKLEQELADYKATLIENQNQ